MEEWTCCSDAEAAAVLNALENWSESPSTRISLDMDRHELTYPEFEHVCRVFVPCHQLSVLSLNHAHISLHEVTLIASCLPVRKIHTSTLPISLELCGNGLDDECMRVLAEYLDLFEDLQLSNNPGISFRGAEFLVSHRGRRRENRRDLSLTELDLSECPIGTRGLVAILRAASLGFPELNFLSLDEVGADADAIPAVLEFIRADPSCVELSLDQNEGLVFSEVALSEALKRNTHLAALTATIHEQPVPSALLWNERNHRWNLQRKTVAFLGLSRDPRFARLFRSSKMELHLLGIILVMARCVGAS